MSAFFVSKEDIDLIVSGLRQYGAYVRIDNAAHRADAWEANQVGRMLWQENLESLAYRYGEGERAEHAAEIAEYEFKAYSRVKAGPLARLVDCYDYQSCEHPGWRASDAFRAICSLREKLCAGLPGYGAGPWGISDPSEIAKVAA